MNLTKNIKKQVVNAPGSVFWIKKTLTSSNITTTAKDLTGVATGQLAIEQVIVKTDSTGLAGGTNFVLSSNNANGVTNILVETVANLGANATKVLSGVATAADTTTSDGTPSVTSLATVIEAGKKLQYSSTSAVCTGAGTIDIFIKFSRIDENATISAT